MKFNKRFWIIAIVAVAGGLLLWNIFKPKEAGYKTEAVVVGSITQEVAETGSVRKGEAINLNFKNSGIIEKISVSQGEEVSAGQVLAELDNRQAQIQMTQAKANYEATLFQLEKLKRGAGGEDVAIVESQVLSARAALDAARRAQEDARAVADQGLSAVYKTAADSLASAYIRAYNAYNFSDLLQREYFSPRDEDSIAVWEMLQKMKLAVDKIKIYSQTAQADGKDAGLDADFAAAKTELAAVEARLREIRVMCEKIPWRDAVSLTHKENLDLHIGYVSAARAAFHSAMEGVASQKASGDLAVNSAAAALESAQAAEKTAGEQYAKVLAPPRAEDVGMLEAQAAQAQAQIALLQLQIDDGKLTAPADGQIAEINGRAGETVSPLAGEPLMVLFPADPYQIVIDIYEEDAVKVSIGDLCKISVAALGDQTFSGRVAFISPAAKIVNGVVYYETKVAFDQSPEGLMPEMTADVEIITAQKENVLLVSEAALRKREDGWKVEVVGDDATREVGVQIGIRAKGIAEIISGIAEGDLVIIP